MREVKMPVIKLADKSQISKKGQKIGEPILSIERLGEVTKRREKVSDEEIFTDDEVTSELKKINRMELKIEIKENFQL